jgi:tight adherence protein C
VLRFFGDEDDHRAEPVMIKLLALAGLFIDVIAMAFAFYAQFELDQALRGRVLRALQPEMARIEGRRHNIFVSLLIFIGFFIVRSGLLSFRSLDETRHTLRSAGLRNDVTLGLFIGIKTVSWGGLALLGLGVARIAGFGVAATIGVPMATGIVGLLLPDLVLKFRRSRFLKRLEAGLAEALDMLVICSDAGLSLDAGLTRVATDIAATHPAVAEEFKITNGELRMTDNASEALLNLGRRTGLDSLKRLGSTLVQTIQYGTPITQALRVLSSELREEQLTRFEERAARMPVLLTVPMILFILPCVFIIVGGPAGLTLMATIHPH